MGAQKIARYGAIGAAAIGNLHAQGDAENFGERQFQRRLARSAAGQQSAIDVEKACNHISIVATHGTLAV